MEHLMAAEALLDSVKRPRTKLQASFTALDPSNGTSWPGWEVLITEPSSLITCISPGVRPGPRSNLWSMPWLWLTATCPTINFQSIRSALSKRADGCEAQIGRAHV